jgi:hypothetical protein
MQTTFPNMGLDPVMPIAPHPNDLVICEDTGKYKRRADCLHSPDGTHFDDDEELAEHNEDAVDEFLNGVIEWSDEYHASEECGGQYGYLLGENPVQMRDNIRYALEELTDRIDFTDEFLNDMIDDLDDCIDFTCTSSCFGSSNQDVVFDSFDCGEVEEQIDINDVPLLAALHDEGKLEGILESLDREFCFGRTNIRVCDDDGKFVRWDKGNIIQGDKHPSVTLINNTDLFYYFGCTNKALLEAYNEKR